VLGNAAMITPDAPAASLGVPSHGSIARRSRRGRDQFNPRLRVRRKRNVSRMPYVADGGIGLPPEMSHDTGKIARIERCRFFSKPRE
jgi:hypothetical protein